MSKKQCQKKRPNAKVTYHSPHNGWRDHVDGTLLVSDDTDYAVIVKVFRELCAKLGYTEPPFVIGFILDMVNPLPEEIRKYIAAGIIAGLGLQVKQQGNEVIVEHVPRYKPVVPQKAAAPIILPSEQEVQQYAGGKHAETDL